MSQTIEITIPILNEQDTLDVQVRKAHEYIVKNLADLPPIVLVMADNGSTDNTQSIAEKLVKELPDVKYIRLNQRGVGRALKASWGQSAATIVGYMDLDLATDLQHLRPAFEALLQDKADIVAGSRLAKGAQVIGRSPVRNVTSNAFNLIVKTYFQTSFTDGMCGFKFLKRSCLDELQKAGAVSDGWFFATEVLVTGEYLGYRVMDLPVKWTDDPNSKVKIIKLSLEYLQAMKALRERLPPRKQRA